MAHRWRLLAFLAIVTAVALPLAVNRARSSELSSRDAASPGTSRETPSALDTVTIEAHRDREIKRQINKFVSGGVVTYLDDSLERWNTPICPLVAGLPSKPAEFIRARVSQVAMDAHAPLGSEHCAPNLVIVITNDPDLLLEKWSQRERLFNTCNGSGPVKRFLHSRQPVRVFYNARVTSTGGPGAAVLALAGVNGPVSSDCGDMYTRLDTWLHRGSVQELTSVIIIVDGRQTANVDMGPLADYIAMVGLAQIRVPADTGTAPSILDLFRESDPKPLGLSLWDEAFLRSLYATDQSSVLEVAMIKDRMFKQIVGR